MGCCMGKYTTRPKKTSPPDDQISVRTQDKLVITQQPPPPPPATIPPSPLSSNFTPSTTTTTSSSLSLDTAPRTSSSSATSFESKDSVWTSCVKENPHSVRRHPIQGTPLPPPRPDSPGRRQRNPQPRKAEAARSNSPAHHRSCHEGSRIPGSKLHRTATSPSRRYRGDKNWGSSPTRGNRRNINDNRGSMARDICSSCKRCSCHDGGFSSNEEAVSRNTTRFGGDGRCVRRNGVAQQRFQEMECRGKEESPENCDRDSDIAEEDIDNPLIALDCFIFL